MSHMIDDNRFVLIEKYKQKLIEGTNISDRPEEMAVIDSILFRLWQMGWLDNLEQSEPHWIPVTERLPAMGKSVLICDAYGDICIGHRTMGGYYFPDFCDDKIKDVRAWCNLPEPYKVVTT